MVLSDLKFSTLAPTWDDAGKVVESCFPFVHDEPHAATVYRAHARDLLRAMVIAATEAGSSHAHLGRVRLLIDAEIANPQLVLSLLASHQLPIIRLVADNAIRQRRCYFADGLAYLDANLVDRNAKIWRQVWFQHD